MERFSLIDKTQSQLTLKWSKAATELINHFDKFEVIPTGFITYIYNQKKREALSLLLQRYNYIEFDM